MKPLAFILLTSSLQLAAETPQQSGPTASTAAPSPAAARRAPVHGLPKNWDRIEVGDLVIAMENLNEGWWEGIVKAIDKGHVDGEMAGLPELSSF